MEIRRESTAAGDVLIAEGDIDLYNANDLSQAIDTIFATGAGNLTLNLAGVHYIDSMGIGVLVSSHTKFNKAGRKLIIAGALSSVRDVFQRVNLHKHLNLEP